MWRDISSGKEKVVPYDYPLIFTECLKAGKWFGFAQVDIEIPKKLWMKFEHERLHGAKAAAIWLAITLVHSPWGGHHICAQHDRLSGNEDLHLARGVGDGGMLHQRCRQEQGSAGRGV